MSSHKSTQFSLNSAPTSEGVGLPRGTAVVHYFFSPAKALRLSHVVRKPKGLNGALQDLGIQFSGREHSGLDDSRNTAQLASRMMRDGCVMKLTRTQERVSGCVTTPLMSPLPTAPPPFSPKNPPSPKPLFGNAAIGDEEKNVNMDEDGKSKSLRRSLEIATCSKTDTKENGSTIQEPFQDYKSLVSPRTLLNGTATPLLGKGSAAGRRTTPLGLFSPVLPLNAPSRRDSGHSLVLCSTTVGRISHLVPQPVHPTFEPRAAAPGGHTKDHADMETDVMVETEEHYGCYDYVVLGDDDDDNPRPGPPRITAPLCGCGRRAKRQTVCNGGPNHGRGFYCCPVRRSGTGIMMQSGCKFFKWESALIKDTSPANSLAGPQEFFTIQHGIPPSSSAP
ncbi:hypothetical protein CRUP_018934 [Coryphaenoides rupestris]|nr:hypothetical protein CRUP_018934 [Coryphaenoides rupestris]